MATPKTLTLTDDRTKKAYELYGQAKVDNKIAKQAGVGQVVKAPSIGESMAPIVKNTWTATGTTWAVPWSASSVLWGLSAEDPIYAQLNQDALNAYNAPINEEEIKANKLKEYQAQLDALQTVQNDELNKYRIQAQSRTWSGRALRASQGLLGSASGNAINENITTSNNEIEAAVLAQQALARQAIYGEVRKSALDEVEAKKAAKIAGWDAILANIRGASERKAQRNKDIAKKLISSKAKPEDLTDADWKDLESKGYSRQDILMEYQDMKAAQEAEAEKLAREEEKYRLENIKLGAEWDLVAANINKANADITKTQADIINEALKTGRAYSEGGYIFDGATNQLIGSARSLARASGGGGGGSGSGTYTIDGQTYNSQLYSGLKSPTATAVRWQVWAFKSEPTVTNFNQIQEGYLLTQSLDNKTTNPTDDQALIYSLAKVLDPGSVVREGEYATVQKYAQSWVDAYGKWVTQAVNGTGFLSEQARKNIKSTIESKYKTSKKTYDNLSNQYIQGINDLTGRQDGDKFIRDYTVSDQQDTSEEAGNANNPLGI